MGPMSDKDQDKPDDNPFAALGEAFEKSARQWQDGWADWMSAWSGTMPTAAPAAGGAEDGTPPRVDPSKVLEAQMELMRDFQALWTGTTARLMGQDADPVGALGAQSRSLGARADARHEREQQSATA